MWKQHDEFIDLAQARHVVIYKNSDTGAEHHLIHHFNLDACPTCGRTNPTHPVDFHAEKEKKLAELNAHHRSLLDYRSKHPHVRLGNQPK